MLKTFLSNTIVKRYKSFGHFGVFRFRLLYFVYKIWGGLHIRHKEWDWVLEYLPKLHNDKQVIEVLDVGCSRNLFVYEVEHRGYIVDGIDLEPFQEKIPNGINILTKVTDVTKIDYIEYYDFVTCISVLEHIGNDGKGDLVEQKKAINNMCASLKKGGRLLLTIPTKEFAQGHIWHGFSVGQIEDMIKAGFWVKSSEERLGQHCICIERDM